MQNMRRISDDKGMILMFEIRPKGWRKGQTLFNFLEWLSTKGYARGQSFRLADVFAMEDVELEKLFRDFTREWKTVDVKKRLMIRE